MSEVDSTLCPRCKGELIPVRHVVSPANPIRNAATQTEGVVTDPRTGKVMEHRVLICGSCPGDLARDLALKSSYLQEHYNQTQRR